MINPNTLFGRALLIFFWGGLSASIVNAVWMFWRFDPTLIAWLVVFVNMAVVTLKNVLVKLK